MSRLNRMGIAAAVLIAASPVRAQATAVSVELNRLESLGDGCRMHVVIENGTQRVYDGYKLDLVIFGRDGVIARRVALDVAPVRAEKTMVYAFDVEQLACDGFGRVLLNDVVGCSSGGKAEEDCAGSVKLSSRAGAPLVK